ncbi:MAG: DNA repair protein RecN [Bdellovibrionaceae bacterium]|nr:DNA repair protein RecN [Pseudobdellovibrionaceae bacterium]MDW8190696.1 DNA repair protein RecN [Pseudobdellovibrionaceae bacterium]
MLQHLRVQNLAIIEDIAINFEPGLNIITGETGSGKSLLVKGFGLLMGEKSSSDLIRSHHNYALIEGVFDLNKRPDIQEILHQLSVIHPEQPECLIVRRLIYPEKSKVYINDHQVTLQTLKEVVCPMVEITSRSAPLIEITGQFENKNLLSREFQLELLDAFAHLDELRQRYFKSYQKYLLDKKKWSELSEKLHNRQHHIDFLSFQRNEITNLNLKEDEDIHLEKEIAILKEYRRLAEFAALAQTILGPDAQSPSHQLQFLLKSAHELKNPPESLLPWKGRLKHVLNEIEDLSFEITQIIPENEDWQIELEQKQERLSLIKKIQKKYGPRIQDIFQFLNKIDLELKEYEHLETAVTQLSQSLKVQEVELTELAGRLHQERIHHAAQLAKLVNAHLQDLNMKGVTFHIDLQNLSELSASGISSVEFQILQPGCTDFVPLSKAASGGELSRILLALKVVAAREKWPRTYLFDEVDSGVSGVTAQKIGKKLKEVSQYTGQVICVTHLAQVAVYGDHHYAIKKEILDSQQKPRIYAIKLSQKQREEEIAQLLSGETITESSLENARSLLKQAHQVATHTKLPHRQTPSLGL